MTWRRPFTRGALLTMEALWTYALVAFLVSLVAATNERPSAIAVFAVVFLSFSISRFLQASTLSIWFLRLWGMLLSFLVFYFIVRIDFYGDWRFWDFSFADELFNHTQLTLQDDAAAVLGIPLLWFFWVRGTLRGQEYTGFEAVLNSFVIGIGIVAFVEVFAESANAPEFVRYIPIPYVALGLLTVALTHAGRAEDEFGRSFGLTWLVAVGGVVLAVGIVALIFIAVDVSTFVSGVETVLQPFVWLLGKIFYYVTWPFVKLIELLFQGIKELIAQFTNTNQEQATRQLDNQRQPEQDPTEGETPEWFRFVLRVIVASTLVSGLLYLSFTMFRRYAKRAPESAVRESTYSEGRMGADLGDFFGSLMGRLRPNIHLGGDMDAARRLYRDLLAAGIERGVKRFPHETPLELSPNLEDAFTSQTPERITFLFDDARYGGIAPPPEQVQRLREELDALRRR